MRQQIYSVSDVGSDVQGASALSDVVDNQSLDFDPFNLNQTVRQAATGDAARDQDTVGGAAKELWNSILDDVLGPKQNASSQSKRG